MTTDYFSNFFTVGHMLHTERIIDLIHNRVNEDMNKGLCAEFSDKVISDALFKTGPLKAPGQDGFPARAFQIIRAIMKEQVIKAILLLVSTVCTVQYSIEGENKRNCCL